MSSVRQWLSLIPLLFATPFAFALDVPQCDRVEQWAAAPDAEETISVTPDLQLSVLAQDARLVPLFGKSIYAWDRDDFRAFSTTLNNCRKAASKRRDHDARDRVQKAMRAVGAARGPLSQLVDARAKSDAAVAALLEEPASPETVVVLQRAEEVLRGEEIRPHIRGMPGEIQRHLFGLIQAQRYLAEADVAALSERLAQRRGALVAAQQEAENAATAELDAALKALDGLAPDAQGLAALDRMARLPALEKAKPEKARAFRAAVAQKRSAIERAQHETREAEGNRRASVMVAEIGSFDVSAPADLGKLWNLGAEMGEELRRMNAREGMGALNAAFWKRFNAATDEMLDPFKAQLGEIPVSREGLGQLGGAVARLTGIERSMRVMQPYHQAVQERGEQIAGELRRIACNRVLDEAGVSGSDAEQLLWGAGQSTTLGEFVCTVAARGGQVHEYEDAGLLSDTHTVKLTTPAEGFHTLKLHKGEVQPGQTMLVGFEVADANQKRELSVSDWENYVAVALRGGRGTQSAAGASAECERLANKPRNELSFAETQKLMGCVMSTIPTLMQNR